jgi:hypothetical protein
MRSDLSHKGRGKIALAHAAAPTLSPDEQFANLSHPCGALAEQTTGDRALHAIFREPERIARR